MILNQIVIFTNLVCGNMSASNLTSLSTLLPLVQTSGRKTLYQLAFHSQKHMCVSRRTKPASNEVEKGMTASHSWTQVTAPIQKRNETKDAHETVEQELRPRYKRADISFDYNSVSPGVVADDDGVVKKSWRRTRLRTNPLPYLMCVMANRQLTGPQALYFVLAATIPTRTSGNAEALLQVVFSHKDFIESDNNIRSLMARDKHSCSVSLTLDRFSKISMSAKRWKTRRTFTEGKDYKFIYDPSSVKARLVAQWTFYVGFLVDFTGKRITAIDVDEAKAYISFKDFDTSRPLSILLQMKSAQTVQIQPHSHLNISQKLGVFLNDLLA